jgi:hypothetical protein
MNMIRRYKYLILIVCIVILCGALFLSCGKNANEWRSEIQEELYYAGFFWMHDNLTDQRNLDEVKDIIEDNPKKFKEIIYLDSAPEENLDKSIIAFYPSGATMQFVNALMLCAERDGIDVVTYGLSNPVTLDEVLNKREEVWQLIDDFNQDTLNELWQLK